VNSKERVLAALRHEQTDRPPMGEWQINSKDVIKGVMGRDSYWRGGLRLYEAMWDGRRNEVVDGWKRDLVEFTLRTGLDSVLVHARYDADTPIEKPEPVGPGKWRTSAGDILQYSEETDRIFVVERGENPPPQPPDSRSPEPTDSELEIVRHVVSELGETHFIFSAPLIGHPRLSYSSAGSDAESEWWMQVYMDPDKFRDDFLSDVDTLFAEGVRIAKREGIDGVGFGFDFGFNQGPFISPEHFRHAILPGLKARAKIVHEERLFFLLHACGNNRKLMDMIVESGIDGYQSIQPEEKPEELKKLYGKDLALWGGVPSSTLVMGTPEQVRSETEWAIENLSPSSGLVLGTSHSVMPGAKYENFIAMLESGQGRPPPFAR